MTIVLRFVLLFLPMGLTIAPVFNRLNTDNKHGLYTITIRVTINRKSKYFNPNLPKIPKSSWSGKPNRWIKDSYPHSFEINSLLQTKLHQLNNFYLHQTLKGLNVSFSDIKNRYFDHSDKESFNEFVHNGNSGESDHLIPV